MMGKTHIAVGIAAAYLITQPQTAPEFIIATVDGSIGGVMADIDVKIDTSNKYAAKASMDALCRCISGRLFHRREYPSGSSCKSDEIHHRGGAFHCAHHYWGKKQTQGQNPFASGDAAVFSIRVSHGIAHRIRIFNRVWITFAC